MSVTTDSRTALAEAVAAVAESESETALVEGEIALDPIEDARLIALIEEGIRLKREEGRVKRQREKINAQVKAAVHEKGHTILTVADEPVVELLTGVPSSKVDHDLLQRLAPVAYAKALTVTEGERLTYK